MTVIAWDGKTLAADKQSTNVGYGSTVTKIFRSHDVLVGLAGSAGHAMELLRWWESGAKPDAWPETRDKADTSNIGTLVVVDGPRRVLTYAGNGGPYPELCESEFFACGCGRDYALATMYLGHDARRAVEVACALDVFCGMGIDTLTLEGL